MQKRITLYYSNETISYHSQWKSILNNEIGIIASLFTLIESHIMVIAMNSQMEWWQIEQYCVSLVCADSASKEHWDHSILQNNLFSISKTL